MKLSPEQIMLVQSSWEEIEPMSGKIGEAFYAKLFELDKSAAALFEGDINQQARTLMGMIGMAVSLLDKPEAMSAALRDLGERHAQYGVQHAHFAPFGDALIWGVEKALGPAFTPEIREAWEALIDFLFGSMQQSVRG